MEKDEKGYEIYKKLRTQIKNIVIENNERFG